jgi:pimeloyl-ACP methyl ester carboxylesterase
MTAAVLLTWSRVLVTTATDARIAAMTVSDRWELEPQVIAEHSYFWVGVERTTLPDGTTATTGEQMYVEYFVPAEVRHEHPIVLVHGGGGQGIAFLGPGDGKPGWAHYLLAEGYVVYIVDRPGHGRCPPLRIPDSTIPPPTPYELVLDQFRVGAASGRWPGSGEIGDPGVDQFMAQQRPLRFDVPQPHHLWQSRGAELLDRIGPAIVLTHSAGGPFGWVVGDARPDLVKAIVCVEGLPPATVSIPLTYDPPIASPDELAFEPLPDETAIEWRGLERVPRVVQADPPRRLVNLARIPIVCVTTDDPWFGAINRSTIAYLRQAGCSVDELRLADLGIRGNGHFAPLEENRREVLGVILRWLDERAAGA